MTRFFLKPLLLGLVFSYQFKSLQVEAQSASTQFPNAFDTPLSPEMVVDNRGRLARFIGLSPEARTEVADLLRGVTAADLADEVATKTKAKFEAELGTAIRERGTGFLAKLLRAYADQGVDLATLRAAIFKANGQQTLEIPVEVHPTDFSKLGWFKTFLKKIHDQPNVNAPVAMIVEVANERLRSIGFDFVKFVAVKTDKARPSTEPLPTDQVSYEKLAKGRAFICAGLAVMSAFLASVVGNWDLISHGFVFDALVKSAPALTAGVLVGGLEIQFSLASKIWDRFVWRPLGVFGPLLANIFVPALVQLAGLGVAHSIEGYQPSSGGLSYTVADLFSTNSTSRILLSALYFTASFGLFQTALSKMKQEGELSEGPRFRQETSAVFYNGGLGRALYLALRDASAGAIIQSSFATLVTLPYWFKRWLGNPSFDAVTRAKFTNQPISSCKRVLASIFGSQFSKQ